MRKSKNKDLYVTVRVFVYINIDVVNSNCYQREVHKHNRTFYLRFGKVE